MDWFIIYPCILLWIYLILYIFIIKVSILRFTIRILRFNTIQMDKDMNLYFVSLERRILRIMFVSRYDTYPNDTIILRYVYFFSTLPLMFDFTHPIRRLENLVWEKKCKKRLKTTKKRKNILAIEREESKTPSMRQCKWVTLIYFIYFLLSCRDRYSKAQGGQSTPLILKNNAFG
jgi:hypothetical protein